MSSSTEKETPRDERDKVSLGTRVARVTVPPLFGLAAASGAVLAAPDTTVHTDNLGLNVRIGSEWNPKGGTTVETPIGDIKYATHRGPFATNVRASGIDFPKAMQTLQKANGSSGFSEDVKQDVAQVKEGIKDHHKRDLAIFGIAGALGAAAGGSAVEKSKNGKEVLQKGGRSLLAASLMTTGYAATTAASYDPDAAKKPTYSSNLQFIKDQPDVLKTLDAHDAAIAQDVRSISLLNKAARQLDSDGNPEPAKPAMRGLFVSDIHNRNVSPLLKSIIDTEHVDAVFDTGDITDRGTKAEADRVGKGIKDLGVPFYDVMGNHEKEKSRKGTKDVLERYGVINLDDKTVILNGLRISGQDDIIGSGKDKDNAKDIAQARKDVLRRTAKDKSDILLVHNPAAVPPEISGVDFIASGHGHPDEPKYKRLQSGTDLLMQGTTGGAGVRAYAGNEKQPKPQSLSIIDFDKTGNPTSTIDYVIRDESLSKASDKDQGKSGQKQVTISNHTFPQAQEKTQEKLQTVSKK